MTWVAIMILALGLLSLAGRVRQAFEVQRKIMDLQREQIGLLDERLRTCIEIQNTVVKYINAKERNDGH